MYRLRIFFCLIFFVATIKSCLIPDKKDGQEVHFIHIELPNGDPGEDPSIIQLHIPESRDKRDINKMDKNVIVAPESCKVEADCPAGQTCILESSKCQSTSESVDTEIMEETPSSRTLYFVPIN